jgi:hypothetical protein
MTAEFRGSIDRKPEQIMRVTGSAVTDGGICLDLRGMDHVEVDADQRTAGVGGGATWGSWTPPPRPMGSRSPAAGSRTTRSGAT